MYQPLPHVFNEVGNGEGKAVNKFRIFCALLASVIIMAAPAYTPDAETDAKRNDNVNTENLLARS